MDYSLSHKEKGNHVDCRKIDRTGDRQAEQDEQAHKAKYSMLLLICGA
jgi:hypothetical protein